MLPFEFCIKGPPVSLQTRNRQRLQAWKTKVRNEAVSGIPGGAVPHDGPVRFEITYYYEGDTPDVDNIIKPIQDALVGVVYVDDELVSHTSSRKRSLDGSYRIRGASGIVLSAFADDHEFLHIRVSEYEEDAQL